MATTATCLHYGISVYEGISTTTNAKDGKIQAFRVNDHLKSFYNSSKHLDMPTFDQKELLECLKKLVTIDKDWYPKTPEANTQVYIRLCHISTDDTLGVKTPKKTKIFCILNPSILK